MTAAGVGPSLLVVMTPTDWRRADAADAAPAAALEAALPDVPRLRFGMQAGSVAVMRPAVDARDGGLDRLRPWLEGTAAQPPRPPVSSGLRSRRGPLPTRFGGRVPAGARLLVPGWSAWAGSLPALLGRRPDLRAVGLMDDVPVGLAWPEYASPAIAAALPQAVAAMARHAASVIVADEAAAGRVAQLLAAQGASRTRIVVEPRPSAFAGSDAQRFDPRLAAANYMVVCGPIEARANTLLLLQVWRDLAASNQAVPRLVLAGQRGREVEDIRPLLDWNEALHAHVAEAPSLPREALRLLLVHARALLVPDFAGADGPLMRDALACGLAVLAADTPAARVLPDAEILSPIDGPGWRAAVLAATRVFSAPCVSRLLDWRGYAIRLTSRVEAA